MAYIKPQSPIMNGADYIYPLTTADQVVVHAGDTTERRLEQNGVLLADDSSKLGGVAAENYLLTTGTAADSSKLGGKVPEYYIQPLNLLDNSNFKDFIARAGLNAAHGGVNYIGDRWKRSAGLTATKTSNGIILTSTDQYIGIHQDSIKTQVGMSYTFAVKGNGNNVAIRIYDNETGNVYYGGNEGALSGILTASFVARTEYVRVYIYPGFASGGGAAELEWAAVYEGTHTANNLPPYVPKGYAAELLACKVHDNNGLVPDGAGAHNAVYRGAYLGDAVTDEQYAAIGAGTFENLFIGDYWTIGGVNYRIAAFDYYLNTGDTKRLEHHVTIVPDTPLSIGVRMNDSGTTSGAYVGSKMYAEGLTQAWETITAAFGLAHMMTHRNYFNNAVTDGYASGGSWYNSTIDLMNEQNVYGCRVYGNAINGTSLPDNDTIDKTQFPLFKFNPSLIANGYWIWLRDVASSDCFANVGRHGYADASPANYTYDVRPAFSIMR